ncbi:MAG: hypothetical protein WAV89_01065 [Ignavibacteriaceae bacterium]
MTSSSTVELFRIAIYLSVSVGPVRELSPLDGEKFLINEETPVIALRKSVFSAGKTDVVDLYHLGEISANTIAEAVIIKTKKNKNHLYLIVIVINS